MRSSRWFQQRLSCASSSSSSTTLTHPSVAAQEDEEDLELSACYVVAGVIAEALSEDSADDDTHVVQMLDDHEELGSVNYFSEFEEECALIECDSEGFEGWAMDVAAELTVDAFLEAQRTISAQACPPPAFSIGMSLHVAIGEDLEAEEVEEDLAAAMLPKVPHALFPELAPEAADAGSSWDDVEDSADASDRESVAGEFVKCLSTTAPAEFEEFEEEEEEEVEQEPRVINLVDVARGLATLRPLQEPRVINLVDVVRGLDTLRPLQQEPNELAADNTPEEVLEVAPASPVAMLGGFSLLRPAALSPQQGDEDVGDLSDVEAEKKGVSDVVDLSSLAMQVLSKTIDRGFKEEFGVDHSDLKEDSGSETEAMEEDDDHAIFETDLVPADLAFDYVCQLLDEGVAASARHMAAAELHREAVATRAQEQRWSPMGPPMVLKPVSAVAAKAPVVAEASSQFSVLAIWAPSAMFRAPAPVVQSRRQLAAWSIEESLAAVDVPPELLGGVGDVSSEDAPAFCAPCAQDVQALAESSGEALATPPALPAPVRSTAQTPEAATAPPAKAASRPTSRTRFAPEALSPSAPSRPVPRRPSTPAASSYRSRAAQAMVKAAEAKKAESQVKAPLTVDESIALLLEQVDGAGEEKKQPQAEEDMSEPAVAAASGKEGLDSLLADLADLGTEAFQVPSTRRPEAAETPKRQRPPALPTVQASEATESLCSMSPCSMSPQAASTPTRQAAEARNLGSSHSSRRVIGGVMRSPLTQADCSPMSGGRLTSSHSRTRKPQKAAPPAFLCMDAGDSFGEHCARDSSLARGYDALGCQTFHSMDAPDTPSYAGFCTAQASRPPLSATPKSLFGTSRRLATSGGGAAAPSAMAMDLGDDVPSESRLLGKRLQTPPTTRRSSSTGTAVAKPLQSQVSKDTATGFAPKYGRRAAQNPAPPASFAGKHSAAGSIAWSLHKQRAGAAADGRSPMMRSTSLSESRLAPAF